MLDRGIFSPLLYQLSYGTIREKRGIPCYRGAKISKKFNTANASCNFVGKFFPARQKTTDPEIRKKSAAQTDSGLDRHDTETLNSFYSGSPRRFPGWQSRRNAAARTACRIRSAPTWLCKCGCSQRLPPSSRHRPGDQSAYSDAGGRATPERPPSTSRYVSEE